MKWLVWSTIDLKNGLGGVETHAQCVGIELEKRGVEVVFSSDPKAPFKDHWDVIHTHGSQYDLSRKFLRHLATHPETAWCHTLHGWSIERMWACHEYYWLGGYRAWWRERVAANSARHVFGVHPGLSHGHRVRNFSVCGNGWNAAEVSGHTTDEMMGQLIKEVSGRWLFIGRGADRVKGAERLIPLAQKIPLVAVPGDGFEFLPWVYKTGVVTPMVVSQLLKASKGLIIPSYYEGLPLVCLEALGNGVPVIATKVGGLKTLDENLKNIWFTDHKLKNLLSLTAEVPPYDRAEVAIQNRKHLRTWSDVADKIYKTIVGPGL